MFIAPKLPSCPFLPKTFPWAFSLMNRLLNRKIISLLFFLLLTSFVHGQIYNFRSYNVQNGFPQENADHILQDHNGYLWFSTQVGAVRFDGHEYFILNTNKGLAFDIVRMTFEDEDNNLWIATRNGISMYRGDSVISYFLEDGLPSNNILHIWNDEKHTLWVMTANGLAYKSKENNRFNTLDVDLVVNCTYKEDNRILVGTENGLYIQQDTSFKPFYPDMLDQYSVHSIAKDHKGNYWLATGNIGLLKFDYDQVEHYHKDNGFVSNHVYDLLCDSRGEIWIGTEGAGVVKYNGEEFIHFSESNGMNNTSVLYLMEDKENNIWIGGRNGATMFNPYNPFVHYHGANGHGNESVFGMLEDSEGNFWFTTYGNGVFRYDGKNYTQITKEDGLGDNRVFSVIEDQKGDIWFSTAAKGIVRYNGQDFKIYDASRGFADIRVFKILEDHEGNLWAGTSGMGAVKFDGSNFVSYAEKEGLSGNIVMSIHEDRNKNLWFGTVNNGITKYNGEEFVDYSEKYKLPAQFIRSISEDRDGNIWFGTGTYGVFRVKEIREDSALCQYINTSNGLNSNNVYFTLIDSENQLWVGTEKGINRIRFTDQYEVADLQSYSASEGFVGVETSINGSLEDSEGNLWFGSVKGATKYIPGIEKRNEKPPVTHLTTIKLFYQETNWKEYADSLSSDNIPVNLTLPHSENHLTFEYIGICYTNPEKVAYKFKLEGLEKEWSPLTYKREAVYSSIPPGEYTFKLMARNNNGIWTDAPYTFSFVITPPYWQRPWFLFVVIFLGLSIVGGSIRWRIQNLKKAKAVLENKVVERTREIREQKKDIEEKNEELNNINEELKSQKDEIEKQKNTLSNQHKEITRKNKEITSSIRYAQHIQSTVLPPPDYIRRILRRHFIFYRPRDIVSGDFYYVTQMNNKVAVAVADCTGHGVPGAFMSMMGLNLIKETVNEYRLTQASKLLDVLRSKVIESLHQKEIEDEVPEGIDMALCIIDKENLKMQFSGALSHLYIVRNGELIEQKGDRMSLCIHKGMLKPFSNHWFNLNKGDMVYLSTDGYPDQLNESRKKFLRSRFKETIIQISTCPFEEQKQRLEEIFGNWKGKHEQIDDVLVMGIMI